MNRAGIRRYKRVEDYTVAEHLERRAARIANRPEPRFETEEYRQACIAALDAAGLLEQANDGE